MNRLIEQRTNIPWVGGTLKLWLGNELTSKKRVSSVCGFVTYGKQLVLVDHKTRRWELPGGHVENNETFHQAFFREIKEEANIDHTQIDTLTLFGHFELPNSLMLVYKTRLTTPEVSLKSNVTDEITKAGLFHQNNLPQNTQHKIWAPYLPYLT